MYGDWEPYAQTRQAMDFIDRHADQPFALFLSWQENEQPLRGSRRRRNLQ